MCSTTEQDLERQHQPGTIALNCMALTLELLLIIVNGTKDPGSGPKIVVAAILKPCRSF
jgi:hypothetical protein